MTVQNLVVALLVAGCFGYALWALGPKTLRNRLAAKLLTLPCPLWVQKRLQATLLQQGGCGGCGGCDGKVAPKSLHTKDVAGSATHVRPLVFQPRARSVLRAKHEGNQ